MKNNGSILYGNRARLKDIFVDTKATAAILQFLNSTDVGKRHNNQDIEQTEYQRRENVGIDRLDQPDD
ncbi:hypothetical protein OnM2_039087 [Erysiphe neolycopersici]|uniref:Uncharacterized protein n=1 Tax=Erysiphe neolycopersici TaxID=212602 RepID=A0A420HW79_9PEZI|nr:hypothetical protein OnM2_039087 [Erysiphe neolycopersici]